VLANCAGPFNIASYLGTDGDTLNDALLGASSLLAVDQPAVRFIVCCRRRIEQVEQVKRQRTIHGAATAMCEP
jgi:hypothetical protein